jgi:hypothetical protein
VSTTVRQQGTLCHASKNRWLALQTRCVADIDVTWTAAPGPVTQPPGRLHTNAGEATDHPCRGQAWSRDAGGDERRLNHMGMAPGKDQWDVVLCNVYGHCGGQECSQVWSVAVCMSQSLERQLQTRKPALAR